MQQPEMMSFGGSNNNEQAAEAASPISSRPPAASSSINFDESLAVVADHHHHNNRGGISGGSGGNNRWPRQETLALLKIRSDMDLAFRDATLKGPLWDDVSRKLGELGYVRSGKKCKEKFENVHKYYKRTKEDRTGRRHDRKTYRFFTQLEAMQPPPPPTAHQHHQQVAMPSGPPTTATLAAHKQFVSPSRGVSQPVVRIGFSSDRAFSDSDDEVDDDEDDMMFDEDEDEIEESSNPKRKRSSPPSSSSGSGRSKASKRGRMMMDLFEGLMKQVMQKQEAMQLKFMETIEKREHDRLMREEAWKQNEAARIGREQELAAKERAMAASRDALIVSYLHNITGQTIQLPPQPQPQPQPVVYTTTAAAAAPMMTHGSSNLQSWQHQHTQPQNNTELVIRQQQAISPMPPPPPPPPPVVSSEIIMAIPERQLPPSSQSGQELTIKSTGEAASAIASSSRWPKAEVLALIKLRSNLENRYEEAGPKGPLWEEISAGMERIGYNRSSKRCKEKWENINKYFKKVKESNKKRPQDAKTCPYYNELDALYQRKKLTGSGGGGDQLRPNNIGGSGKPEDIMMEQQKQFDSDEDRVNNNDQQKSEKERKTGYKLDQFQRPTNNKNGGTSSSFNITMVQ